MKVGLVGFGNFAPNIYRNLHNFGFIDEITVCDLSLDALKKVQTLKPEIKISTTQNLDIILNDSEIGAVFIATPIQTHYSIARKCLLERKHVFLEKPMAFTEEEAKTLVAIAQTNKRLLHIDNTFVFSSEIGFLKECLKFDVLGKPLYYRSTRANRGPFLTNTTVIEDLLTHDVSIIHYLFPDKTFHAISATGAANLNSGVFDDADVKLFAENFTAHVHVSWVYPEKTRKIIIGGTQSIITHDSSNGLPPKAIDLKTGNCRVFDRITNLGEPLLIEINHFFERLFRNETTLSNGDEGIKIIKVLEAAQKSLKMNGNPVKLN